MVLRYHYECGDTLLTSVEPSLSRAIGDEALFTCDASLPLPAVVRVLSDERNTLGCVWLVRAAAQPVVLACVTRGSLLNYLVRRRAKHSLATVRRAADTAFVYGAGQVSASFLVV